MLVHLVRGEDIYAGLCNWVPDGTFVYMSGVCLVHKGNTVMFDYCDYWDGDHSDGHDQNGYHAEVYRKKKGLHVGHDKSLVKSLSINLPGGAYGNIDVDPDANCGDVSVNENGIFYDVFVSGEINAAAMKFNGACNAAVSAQVDIKVGSWGSGSVKQSQILDALYQLQDLVLQDCNRKQFYVYTDGAIVGAWFGDWIHPQGAYSLVSALIKEASQNGVANRKSVEYCGTESNKAGYRMGIAIDTTSNIAGIKQTVSSWSSGGCVAQSADVSTTWSGQALQFYATTAKTSAQGSVTPAPYNSISSTYEIKSGDTCASIISDFAMARDLDYFNSVTYGWYGCDAIVPGQIVSVSGGWPRKLSYNYLFEIASWMDDYESAYSTELYYCQEALTEAKLQLSSASLTNYTLQIDTVYLAMWSGAWIDNSNLAGAFDYFVSTIARFGTAKILQHANENDPAMTFGVIVTTDSSQAEEAMQAWQEGRRYSKGSIRPALIAGPIYKLPTSKSGAAEYADVAMSPSTYSSWLMAPYVFAHTKSSDATVDKFYSTIAAGKVGIPNVQLDIAKHPAFPLNSVLSKAVHGPVDDEVAAYVKQQQWVYDGGNVIADAPGNEIEELEAMDDMTTDLIVKSCTIPIFVVNAGYQSPGMACTAYAHISGTRSNVFTYGGSSLMTSQAACAKQASPRVSGIPILEQRASWQQATFPYGTTGTSQCVDASDIWIEGRSFQRFANAEAAEKSSGVADRYKTLDWSRCDPMNPNSPKRTGPLVANQQYIVLIEYPTLGFGNCSIEYTRA
ncbi:hypothetical protein LPJ74_005404 [Coemansia sp. RSA 1843]|nr:hypothetical protein LPJ74_005404 [Coemansia sp. RSA 1843]